jgi:hypothetical protein
MPPANGCGTLAAGERQDQDVRVANSRRMQRRSSGRAALRLLAAALLSAGPLLAATTPAAAAGTRTAIVPDVAEAWYASGPINVCKTPLGCPPSEVPQSPYPADTLHIGVAGGQETSRTYVEPDLLTVPLGATLLSGSMTLPVATAAQDGTVQPTSAEILACLVTKPFADGTAGSAATTPATDCRVSATPTYLATADRLRLDLTPFLRAWAKGRPSLGIALLPSPSRVQQSDAWHVTIDGRQLSAEPHVTSTITYKPAPSTTGSSTSVTTPSVPVVPAAPAAAAPPAALPPPTVGTLPATPPIVAPSQPAAPVAVQPVALQRGFQYPLAFLFPLALVAGVAFFIRLFTRDPLPREVAA